MGLNDLSTLFTGKNLMALPEIESTNSFLMKQLRLRELPEGTTVITHVQTSGRGQQGSHWLSEPGKNNLFSIVFYPKKVAADQLFILSQTMSLGIRDAVEKICDEHTYIKWPNDIYVQNKKVCGILIENNFKGSDLNYSIAGFGLNVNQTNFGNDLPHASSLKNISGIEFNLDNVLATCLQEIEKRYLQLFSEKYNIIRNDYLQFLYRRNILTSFKHERSIFEGMIQSTDETGKLIIDVKNEGLKTFDLKELEMIIE